MRKMLIAAVGIALIAAVPAAATGGFGDSMKAQHVKAQHVKAQHVKARHVERFVLHESASHPFNGRRNAGTDELRQEGKLVGFDSFTNYANPLTKVVFRFALALKHGQIVGRVVQLADGPGTREGTILYGTGGFAGIEGTTTINIDRHGRQHLVLRYQL